MSSLQPILWLLLLSLPPWHLRLQEKPWRGTKIGRYVITVIAILSCFLVSEAKADFTSGNDLWEWCQIDNDPIKDAGCTFYILAAGETFQVLQVAKHNEPL